MSFRLSPQTLDQLKARLAQSGTGVGVRLSVTKPGCSGLAYKLVVVDHVPAQCQCVTIDELKLFIDEETMVYLAGSELDLASHFPCHLFSGQQFSTVPRCNQPMTHHA